MSRSRTGDCYKPSQCTRLQCAEATWSYPVCRLAWFIDQQAHMMSDQTGVGPQDQRAGCTEGPAGDDMTSPFLRELLWLEGSLLLLLVDHRQQERRLSESTRRAAGAEEGGGPQYPIRGVSRGGPGGGGASVFEAAGSGAGGSPARSLAAQMMRALATEKGELQRKLSQRAPPVSVHVPHVTPST